MYIINCYFKLYLLTPLILPTLTLAVLNNLSIAKPSLFINITAPFIKVTALFINIIASPINITAPPIKVIAAVNYNLIIFNNLYNKICILQEVKIKGFLTMLYNITFNFYYKNKATYTIFNSIYNAIYSYFKGPEYKHRILIK